MKKLSLFLIIVILAIISFLVFNYFKKGTFSQPTEMIPEKFYDVADFGANGNDEIADTLAFQNALDKAKDELNKNSGKVIEIDVPSGIYYIDKTLYVYSNTILHLDAEAVVKKTGSKGGFLMSAFLDNSGNRCLLQDENLTNGCNKGGYTQWNNIMIEGGTFDFNNINASFYFRHGENLTIKNSEFINIGSLHAFNLSANKDVLIKNIIVRDQTNEEGQNRPLYASEIIHLDTAHASGEPTTYPVDGTPVMNVIIEDSKFNNILSGIGSHGLYTEDSLMGNNIIIRNNTFTNVGYFAINLAAHKNVEIYDNIAVGLPGSYAFLGTGYTGANVHDNTISGFDNSMTISTNNKYNLQYDSDMEKLIINNYYTVKFNSNGGVGEMPDVIFYFGETSKLNKNLFTRDGYKFVGWRNHRIIYDTWCASYELDGTTKRSYMTEAEMINHNAKYCVWKDEADVYNLLPSFRQTTELIAVWKQITNIAVLNMPKKIKYTLKKDKLDLTGGIIRVTYDDGTHDDIEMQTLEHSEFDNSKLGKQQILLKYLGVTVSVPVNVVVDKKTINFGEKILEVDKTSNILYKISPYLTYGELFGNSSNDSDAIIKTGDIVKVDVDGVETTLTASVLGDITGDGVVEINDVGKLYRYYNGKIDMSQEFVYAGDVNYDGIIEINDVGKLYRYYSKTITDLS